MSNAQLLIHRPKIMPAPLILAMIYAMGVPAFLFLWSGQQSIAGFAGFEKYGPLYALLCLLGVICNIAIVRGIAWGVIGQLGVWGATLAVNILLQRSIAPAYLGLALLFVGFWAFDLYRNRQLLGKMSHAASE